MSDGESTEHGVEYDPDGPKNPFKPGPKAMPLRMADKACEKLEQLDGIPRFKKHWPLAKRDEAIAATMAYLKRYGERFRENAASRAIRAAEPGIPKHEKAILAFDPLDRPATADDVAEGRAIFSLDGAGAEVRRVALPSFPMTPGGRSWRSSPTIPPSCASTMTRARAPNIEGIQTGRVWQAEEVREGDRWRRYYGFVGRHALTRVPAEEIEFPAPWQHGWSRLSTDLDARIVVEDAATTGPLPIEVSFRNHRGVETTAPADLVRDADGALTIREGIAFRLVRESDKPDQPDPFAGLQGAPRRSRSPRGDPRPALPSSPQRGRVPDARAGRDGPRVSARPSHPLPRRSARPLPPGDHLRRPWAAATAWVSTKLWYRAILPARRVKTIAHSVSTTRPVALTRCRSWPRTTTLIPPGEILLGLEHLELRRLAERLEELRHLVPAAVEAGVGQLGRPGDPPLDVVGQSCRALHLSFRAPRTPAGRAVLVSSRRWGSSPGLAGAGASAPRARTEGRGRSGRAGRGRR